MASTNSTTNLQLSQFGADDTPKWLQDYNGDMAKIDAFAGQKGQASGLASLDSGGKLEQMPTAADVGAVPTSRTVNGKALSSNISLTATDVGAKYTMVTLYNPGDSPRSNQGNLNLTDSLNNYDLVIVVTSMKTNAYVNTYCNVFVPSIFKATSATMIAGYTADGSIRGEQFQFMRKDGQPDYSGNYCYLPETLESFGIKTIYGLQFGSNESSEEVSA